MPMFVVDGVVREDGTLELGQKVDLPPHARTHQRRIDITGMIGRQNDRPLQWNPLSVKKGKDG